jgi:hypothetical protein
VANLASTVIHGKLKVLGDFIAKHWGRKINVTIAGVTKEVDGSKDVTFTKKELGMITHYSGTNDPPDSLGEDGDEYFKYD